MRRAYRTGFTLIELMVVIGIILLLVSIVVFGLRHVNAMAARKETIAEMNICQGMLKEYESVNGTINIEGSPGSATVPKITVPNTINPPTTVDVKTPVYIDGTTSGDIRTGPPSTYVAINDLVGSPTGDMGDRGGSLDGRYIAQAVYNTRAIMYVLLKDSKNRAVMGQVPAKRIMEGPPDSTGTSTIIPADYSMILDGWGNPIIYVPKGGMLVYMSPSGQGVNYIIRSSGSYLAKPDGSFAFTPPSNSNDAPFWASAGQDQIFTDPQSKTDNAIDNIYSFQTQ